MDRISDYQSIILDKIPFILSLQDREEFSPTYGSFDRTYWQWKFIDFSGARFQEALLTLSYVYGNKFSQNIYYRNPKILKWIEAGFSYYQKSQHRDGSFDEAYPFERSFVANGFTLFYLSEAFRLVQKDISKTTREMILTTFAKASEWICNNEETHAFISNHRLGTCVGLYNVSTFLQNKKYEERCWELWETVRKNQSDEGWFNEYGGADPGYLTQGIYYASMLYKKSHNKEILDSLNRVLEFIKYFIHPDGTIGGEYGSRNTEFYFPGGFEILAQYNPIAESICREILPNVKANKLPCVKNIDAYNIFPVLNSMVSGCLFFSPNAEVEELPYKAKNDFVKVFDKFKIYVRKEENAYTIIGISKGGVVKVFDIEKRKLKQSCVGIFGKVGNKVISSQFFHKDGLEVKMEKDLITIEAPLVFANYSYLSPIKMLIFRFLSLSVCSTNIGSKYLKKFIVYTLISRKRTTKWKFKRVIHLNLPNEIKVTTQVKELSESIFKEMEMHTSYHMGSSKYYKIGDLFL